MIILSSVGTLKVHELKYRRYKSNKNSDKINNNIVMPYSPKSISTHTSLNQIVENGLIYTVDKNNLWTEAIAINNGDYDIENYDLSLFNDVITINEMTIGTIAPGAYIEIEFQIDDFTENDVMMVLEISNQDHISDCIKGAEL